MTVKLWKFAYLSVIITMVSGFFAVNGFNASQALAADSKKPDSHSVKAADTLEIVGKLIEIPGKFPPNDLYNYVYITKYKVVKVIKGAYTGQEILVGHYNPLFPRNGIKDKMAPLVHGTVDKIEVNARHRLVLIAPISSVWTDAVEDEYSDSDMVKYFALRTDISK
jgi:hypothetical protein